MEEILNFTWETQKNDPDQKKISSGRKLSLILDGDFFPSR